MGMLDDLDARRETAERHRENSARHAQAFGKFWTKGQGSFEYGERVPFQLTFTEEPIVTYGSFINMDDLRDLMNVEGDDTPSLPLCTGYVTEWDRNERDLYVGCWVAVRVNFPMQDMIDPTLQPEIKHFFTFSAIAMKDVPLDYTD